MIKKVSELQIGEMVKIHNAKVFVQSKKRDRVIVSKQAASQYVFSIPIYSANYEDLFNRVEVV
jgi:hypothetical protein